MPVRSQLDQRALFRPSTTQGLQLASLASLPDPFQPPTTQGLQPASLASLPNELVAKIVALVLPCKVADTYIACKKGYSTQQFELRNELRSTPQYHQFRTQQHPLAVSYINRNFHAQARRLLQARAFRIELTDCAFQITGYPKPMEQAADQRANWRWERVFPGLDLSKVTQLTIVIGPVDLYGFWYNAENALYNLSRSRLFAHKSIQKLIIEVEDMRCTCSEQRRGRPPGIWKALGNVMPIKPTVEDYDRILMSLERVIALAVKCEIHVPYWVERLSAKGEFVRHWANLGAQVLFGQHIAPGRPAIVESRMRNTLMLAPLSEDYYETPDVVTHRFKSYFN